ncbi:ABC transporter permease [Marinicrinis sediminis]|uniref:ABC transporter permease n=1 Tax=Marinicrinis sediminis TaxID=1652465 RepID=A0ABW5RBX1_9BACL
MTAVWLLIRSYMQKRILQNSFMVMILFLCALLFVTAVVVINNTGKRYADIHEQVQGSHQILKLEQGLHDPERTAAWWSQQEGVMANRPLRYQSLNGLTFEQKDIPNLEVMLMEMPPQPGPVDQLLFADQSGEKSPAKGSIWIPSSLAMQHHIEVGDQVQFNLDDNSPPLQVSAIVMDLPFSSPFTTTARIWLHAEDYEAMTAARSVPDSYMIALRFEDTSQIHTYWQQFEQFFDTPYLETLIDERQLSSFFLVTNRMIGFIMIVFAAMMLIIALYTIGFTISDAIVSDYRTIGIVRSLGLTPYQIASVYILQAVSLAAAAFIPGIVLSDILSRLIIERSWVFLKAGDGILPIDFWGYAIAVGVFMLLMVAGTAMYAARSAVHLEPVQAIQHGRLKGENKRHRGFKGEKGNRYGIQRFWKLPIFFSIGLNSVKQHRTGSWLVVVISMMTTALLVFGFIFIFSLISIPSTIAQWGYDSSDISMTVEESSSMSSKEWLQHMQQDERVRNVSRIAELNGVFTEGSQAGTSSVEKRNVRISIMAVDGHLADMGMVNLTGRHPRKANELTIGVNAAKTMNKQIGDTVDLYIKGQRQTYMITGTYQAIANLSYSARMTAASVESQVTDSDWQTFLINLKEESAVPAFIDEMKATYGDQIWMASQEDLVDELFAQAVVIFILPVLFIIGLFFFITFALVYGMYRIAMKKNSRRFGIYKTLGISSAQIRSGYVCKVVILSGIGSAIGVGSGAIGLPKLIQVVLHDYGIVQMPLLYHWVGIGLLLPTAAACAGLGAWMASGTVEKGSPGSLIAEG